MKKLWIVALATVGLISACNTANQAGKGYEIEGVIENAKPNTQVFLVQIQGQQPTMIDTAQVAADGSFVLEGTVAEKTLAQIQTTSRQQALLLLDNNTHLSVALNGDDNTGSYTIKGSPENQQFKTIVDTVRKMPVPQQQWGYIKGYADTCKNTFITYVLVSSLPTMDPQTRQPISTYHEDYKKLADRLDKEMAGSKMATEFRKTVDNMLNAPPAAPTNLPDVGKEAPDISLTAPDDKTYSLKDLRGKVVLLDFWASWCGPCRRENPTVVAAYEKYKSKGFEIFSVSLDKAKDPWVKAIEQDKLSWKYHVSDLQFWNSAAARAYGVSSIPASFLLDKDGKIIAKNLRGDVLEQKLAEVLK